MALLTRGLAVRRVSLRAHCSSQMLALKTSQQGFPMASSRVTPVIPCAARLNEVIRQSLSTVKTPSAMESRMIFVACSLDIALVEILAKNSSACAEIVCKPKCDRRTPPDPLSNSINSTTYSAKVQYQAAGFWPPGLLSECRAAARISYIPGILVR